VSNYFGWFGTISIIDKKIDVRKFIIVEITVGEDHVMREENSLDMNNSVPREARSVRG